MCLQAPQQNWTVVSSPELYTVRGRRLQHQCHSSTLTWMDWVAFSFDQVQGWIQAGGYLALFGLLFACGLGLPLPEDIPLIIAGALIAKGHMNWIIASVCAWMGIIGGDCVLYHFGKKFGLEITTRVPFVGKHVTRERIQQVEKLFQQYGIGVVAVGRLFAGIRGAMVIAAGAIRYNFIKFVIADGIAALISGGLFVLLGYWLGNNLTQERIHRFKEWFFVGGVVLVIGLVAWIIWRRRHAQQVVAAEVKVVAAVAEQIDKIPHPHLSKRDDQHHEQTSVARDETAA
jgi:membrane protein DedA with SNARE-associated domain